MRVVLTGGGTGGHIYPALSVAARLEGAEILYVGCADGPEAQLVPRAGLRFAAVPARKLSRRLTPASLAAAAVCAGGVCRAAGMLRAWKPDVVLGTGGFASAGVMCAAALLRIPAVIHEANVVPGRVNRLLGRFCRRVALTYEASARYFPPGRSVVTGLPVRADLLAGQRDRAVEEYGLDPTLPTVVVCGGSGGARTLNRAVIAALPGLAGTGAQIVHQTGRADHEHVVRETAGAAATYHPTAYVENMPALLAAASLVVCRGGSSTLAELTALGVPALVVPYPFAVGDHQTHNARDLERAGAAVCVPDAELSGERLLGEVRGLLGDPARLDRMRAASRARGRPEAAERVAEVLREVARGTRPEPRPAGAPERGSGGA